MDERWNVTFNDSYFENHSTKRQSEEVRLDKEFKWGNDTLYIPAIYICSKGLIVDFLLEEDKDKIWRFIEKFNLLNDESGSSLTKDQHDELERENPLGRHFNATATVNKNVIRQNRSSSCSWIPDLTEAHHPSEEAKEVLEHYGKDLNKAWSIHRTYFEWATAKKPKISNLVILLGGEEQNFPAEHIKNPCIGEKFDITDPKSGTKHILTVEDIQKKSFDRFPLAENGKEFPKNYTVMSYTIEPDIGMSEFHLEDCADSDLIRIKKENESGVAPICESTAIGIIGGADGPVAILTSSLQNKRSATSAMHFDKEYDIEWRAVFRKKMRNDFMAKLI